MSDDRRPVQLPKWPFYLADVVLSGVAIYVLWSLGPISGAWELAATTGCLAAAAFGAWMSVVPWLSEFRRQTAVDESAHLASSMEQIGDLEKVAGLIRGASGQWQGVQDAASRTAATAQEIAARMKAESEEFMKFMDHAQQQERAGLRLEVEKLRRMEGDWIKVSVQMLDHTFALHQAALRSGQQGLIGQLQQFQNACRDAARRMGLAPFVPQSGEPFEAQAHQLTDPNAAAPERSKVGEVLATGYTYQGQLLRRALVTLAAENPPDAAADADIAPWESEPEDPSGEAPEPAAESAMEEGEIPEADGGLPEAEPEPAPEEPATTPLDAVTGHDESEKMATGPAPESADPAQKKTRRRKSENSDPEAPQLRLI